MPLTRSLALLAAFGTLANSLRSNSASVLIRTLLRCSARPNGGGYLSARPLRELRPGWLVRFAHIAGVGLPHSSTLTSLTPHSSLLTPHPHSSLLTPHSSRPHSSLLTPHSSLLTPHPSLLPPHSSPLTPHSSLLTPHSAITHVLTPHSSLLPPPSSLLTPHPSLLTPHPSSQRGGGHIGLARIRGIRALLLSMRQAGDSAFNPFVFEIFTGDKHERHPFY